MQPTNDRKPGQDEEHAAQSDSSDSFEPGASFTDEPAEAGGSSELPSWLQSFGGASGDAGAATAPTATENEPSLEGWNEPASPADLRAATAADPPRPAPERAAQPGQGLGAGDPSFFSEDDLPEWLRALSTESEPAASPAPVAAVSADSGASNGAVAIPPISRAWVTPSDISDVSPGASLLSSLVHMLDNRPDADATEATMSPPPSARSSSKPQVPVLAAAKPKRSAGRWSRPWLLVVLAITILVLFIFMMLSGN